MAEKKRKSRAHVLSYEELIAYGKKYYRYGGDVFVECWSERDFDRYVAEYGPITKSKALRMMTLWSQQAKEEQAMMNW